MRMREKAPSAQPAVPGLPESGAWPERRSRGFRRRLGLHVRLGAVGLHIGYGLGLAFISGLLLKPGLPWRGAIVGHWHRGLCRVLGMKTQVTGLEHLHSKTAPGPGRLFVCNHLSWLDIPVLGQHFPVRFLSKSEVASWPLIGRLADCGGTLYVRRGAGAGSGVIMDMARLLSRGHDVLFFPEGTTTRGHDVLPFHPRLFQAALDVGAVIQPLALRYPASCDGNASVPYVGNDEFLPHLMSVASSGPLVAQIEVCPPVTLLAGARRADIARMARASIVAALANRGDLEAGE